MTKASQRLNDSLGFVDLPLLLRTDHLSLAFPHLWTQKLAVRLAVVALIGSVVGWRTEAVAASVSGSGSGLTEGVESSEPHHCKCGRACRGASCCCSRAKTKPRTPAQPIWKFVDSPRLAESPCVKAAACGDPEGPNPRSVEPVGRAALFFEWWRSLASMSKRFEGFPMRTEVPARRGDRLDDPPERLVAG